MVPLWVYLFTTFSLILALAVVIHQRDKARGG